MAGCSPAEQPAQQDGQAPEQQQSDNQAQQQAPDYSTGTHHAQLVFEGYEDTPVEIEIYSDSAPVTASRYLVAISIIGMLNPLPGAGRGHAERPPSARPTAYATTDNCIVPPWERGAGCVNT